MSAAVVVSASYDKQIRLWDAASGRTVKSFAFQESQINSLFLLPDTGYLAVAGFGVLRLYDLATYLHSGGGAGGAAGGAGMGQGGPGAAGNNANQVPPVYSSFESQSSMNITSLAAVPLLRNANDDQSSNFSGSSRQLTDSSSSALMNDQLLGTVVISDLGALLGHNFKEVASLLIATSEDGHIRFFDANSPVTLRMLKDIATGAAITCSAVSPDRRYLLTGNQMGQVSMWHLPSIVASVAMEMKNNTNDKMNANRAKAAAAAAEEAAETDPTKLAALEKEKEREKAEAEVVKAFGRYALQEINFANDYSAIRSIAIEPLGRWAAVATNAGKVHFIRLARDASVCGSKAGLSASMTTGPAQQAYGGGASSTGQLTPRDPHQRNVSGGGTPQLSPQKSVAGSQAESISSRLPLTGKVGSYTDGSSMAGATGTGGGPTSYHGPRETIYRSALVVNELSANARRTSGASEEGGGGELGAGRPSGISIHNSIGAVLLDHLEQQQNSVNSRSNHGSPQQQHMMNAAMQEQPVRQSAAAVLATQMEMEVFDTIQAHYKYILRVLISPNAELLMTCSADYSVGRFVIPAPLRMNASQAASATILDKNAAAAATASGGATGGTRKASPPRGGGGAAGGAGAPAGGEEEEETHNETFSPSFASTQVPHTGSPGENPVDPAAAQQQQRQQQQAAAAADGAGEDGAAASAGNTNTAAAARKAKAGGTDSVSMGSLAHSFDGMASRAADDVSCEPPMEFKPLKPLTGHQRWVWDGVFSDCSNFLFTASSDNTLRMWNGLTTDRPQSVGFVGHTKPVVAVQLCYDRRRISGGSPSM